MSMAAVAAGADGLLVEVHINPQKALSDKQQQMTPEMFKQYMHAIRKISDCVKTLPGK